MIGVIVLLSVVSAIRLSTTITQTYKLLVLDGNRMHPWFMDHSLSHNIEEQAFVDWDKNRVRQFSTFNNYPYKINVTVRVFQQNNSIMPFIQESVKLNESRSDSFRFTLLPGQDYRFALEYNCSSVDSELIPIHMWVEEQSFKQGSDSVADTFSRYKMHLFKYCVNPQQNIIDVNNAIILFGVFSIILVISIFNIVFKSKQLYSTAVITFNKERQLVILIVVPLLCFLFVGNLNKSLEFISFLIAFFSLWDFTKCILTTIPILQQPQSITHILSFIIGLTLCYLHGQYANVITHQLFMIIVVLQVTKRVILKDYIQLFLFLAIIWVQEINWLAHYHTVDKHSLLQGSESSKLYFQTSISLNNSNQSQWNDKSIEIQLYQVMALTLIQSFILRNGLFNRGHVVQIAIVSIFQIMGLVLFDVLYRNKMNPPFLTIVSGFMLIGMAINNSYFSGALTDPYMKFKQFDQIEMKVKIDD